MHLGTLIAIFGLILSALAGLWYWQIIQVAVVLAGSTGGKDLNRMAWFALTLFFVGLAIFLTCVVINFLVKDYDV